MGHLTLRGYKGHMDDESIIVGVEDQVVEGPIDTTEKLTKMLAGLEPGKIACVFQADLPEFPSEEEDDRDFIICKIMRDNGETEPPPFFLIGLEVDEEELKRAAEEIIENALGGKITAKGMMN